MSEDKKRDNTKPIEEASPSSRRAFLKFGALAGAAGLLGSIPALASATETADDDSEETVALLNQDGVLVAVKKSALVSKPKHPATDTANAKRIGVPGKSFVMVVDLASCRNARRCVDACQHAHGLRPDQEYVRVHKMQDSKSASKYWMPQLCNQCDNPPCTKVCPVDATFKRKDGVVAIDNDQCIGCRFCMAACPYSARVFNWNEPKAVEGPPVCASHSGQVKKKGTVDKCDFCAEMSQQGELPHCVSACPNGVFYFGDKNEDVVTNGHVTVRLSKLLHDGAGYRYMEDLGTEPRVYYLPPRNREFPFEQGIENYKKAEERIKDYRLDINPKGKTEQ